MHLVLTYFLPISFFKWLHNSLYVIYVITFHKKYFSFIRIFHWLFQVGVFLHYYLFSSRFSLMLKNNPVKTHFCAMGCRFLFSFLFLQGRNNIFLVPMTREWNTKTTCYLTMGSQPFFISLCIPMNWQNLEIVFLCFSKIERLKSKGS